MHPVGQSWIEDHEDAAEDDTERCKAYHGLDYRGSALSKTWTDRVFSVGETQKSFAKGHKVSCYDCHDGPTGD